MITSNSVGSTGRPLRLLIVDDNHINLSVLSTLLRGRFNHILEGAPVTVDSGLKAIQLLRTHVFDCIFMDIQMPFLSGLDATRRIRNAEDGILAANSDAHIVAVTTAVGPKPEVAYRRAGMDGMIGKPVRFQSLQQYLCPLAQQASIAAHSITPIHIDSLHVMPPLPPASKYERVFYLPIDATTPASRPEICKGEDFEKLLDGQTRASLRQCGTMALTRTGKSKCNSPNPQATKDDICTHFTSELQYTMPSSVSLRSNSSSSLEGMENPSIYVSRSSSSSAASRSMQVADESIHLRNSSMTISQETLDKQIAREMANADLSSDDHFNNYMSPRSIRRVQSRPQVAHRTSSPGWLVSEQVIKHKSMLGLVANSTFELSTSMNRPKLAVHCESQATQSSSSSSYSTSSFDCQSTPSLRRQSQVSASSVGSGTSSNVTTPSIDEASLFHWSDETDHVMASSDKEHQRLPSNSTVNSLDEYNTEGNTTWGNQSSEDSTSDLSSPCKNIIWSQKIPLSGKNSISASEDISPLQQVQTRQSQIYSQKEDKYEDDPSEHLQKLELH